MDLSTVTDLIPAPAATWRPGDAYLGGGTWLFSEPQPQATRLLDLIAYQWPGLTETDDGLEIAATCTIAELARWRPRHDWPAGRALPRQCADALLGSFKVQNAATVGGNICLALPAGPMIALAAALSGIATLWGPGKAARQVTVAELVTGERRTILRPGELLRSVFLPAAALARRAACRQVSLSAVGRSAVLLIATRGPQETLLTVTASVPRPVQARLPGRPLPQNDPASSLHSLISATTGYLDDVHGSARWRAAMTRRAVTEVLSELAP